MPRIIGTDIPGNKRLIISLTYIFGIGDNLSAKVIKELRLDPDMKASGLTEDQIARIGTHLQENYAVEGDLRREVSNNIKRLISINSYRGLRHRVGLPVRGQKTGTNARTRKGKKKTVANKKKAV
mgnify:CR=1 FL=1|jgi:small subunit ribosomal protein S13